MAPSVKHGDGNNFPFQGKRTLGSINLNHFRELAKRILFGKQYRKNSTSLLFSIDVIRKDLGPTSSSLGPFSQFLALARELADFWHPDNLTDITSRDHLAPGCYDPLNLPRLNPILVQLNNEIIQGWPSSTGFKR
jgi:hypothetical protein